MLCRYGGTFKVTFSKLYAEGGVRRFYRGMAPALLQGPLSRFGDTAANTGVLVLLDSYDSTRTLPVAVKTMAASAVAGLWRINLMPIDTLKTVLQVEGPKGLAQLRSKIAVGGVGALYQGAIAASVATFAGHYPWFFTYNLMNEHLPKANTLPEKLLRGATMGFVASLISDTVSNSIRVTKVVKQASPVNVTYVAAVQQVLREDGVKGLLFRGLGTKILANGLQGMLFSVLWRLIEDARK
jgi:hypothetical protein